MPWDAAGAKQLLCFNQVGAKALPSKQEWRLQPVRWQSIEQRIPAFNAQPTTRLKARLQFIRNDTIALCEMDSRL
jgi:hypothetical protein